MNDPSLVATSIIDKVSFPVYPFNSNGSPFSYFIALKSSAVRTKAPFVVCPLITLYALSTSGPNPTNSPFSFKYPPGVVKLTCMSKYALTPLSISPVSEFLLIFSITSFGVPPMMVI